MRKRKVLNKEMTSLRLRLTRNHYTWIDNSDEMFKRTLFNHRGHLVSVICGEGSYGGKHGLLEMHCPSAGIDATGWLTAKDVMEIVKERITEDYD